MAAAIDCVCAYACLVRVALNARSYELYAVGLLYRKKQCYRILFDVGDNKLRLKLTPKILE